MYGTARRNPIQAYSSVGIETGVMSANPHKLIVMLFEGALVAVSSARMHMEQKHIAEKGESVTKAIDIIGNGLKASLDVTAGGELAERLSALYDYMCARLLHANARNDRAALIEVAGLLAELKGAWEEIASDPAVLSANNAQR
jgi:flagellar protein FliS